jgi:hypothetical protein
MSQVTADVNTAKHFTLVAGVGSVYVCTLQQTAIVEESCNLP